MTLRRAVLLTMAVFALQPLAFGAWLAMIPDVKADLGLGKVELAVALLGMPIALIPSLQVAGWMMGRFGPRRVLACALPATGLALMLPLQASGQGQLFGALAVLGMTFAFSQVALNVYAGRLEKSEDIVVMSRCHGVWAVGLMVGSLAAATFISVPGPTRLALLALASSVPGMICALLLPRLAGSETGAGPKRRSLGQIPGVLFLISIFALTIGLAEGAMADWSAVYLAERWPEGAARAGFAVSLYSGFLAAGRFLGDVATARLGRARLARLSSVVAILGIVLMVGPWPILAAFVGCAVVGLGVSVGYPLAVSATAALDDTYEGANIAVLSTIALTGFLIGPPMIGFLAETYSLRVGLGVLIPILAAGFVCAAALRARVVPKTGESGADSPQIPG